MNFIPWIFSKTVNIRGNSHHTSEHSVEQNYAHGHVGAFNIGNIERSFDVEILEGKYLMCYKTTFQTNIELGIE